MTSSKEKQFVSPEDGFHKNWQCQFYDILFDNGKFTELDANVESIDMLNL